MNGTSNRLENIAPESFVGNYRFEWCYICAFHVIIFISFHFLAQSFVFLVHGSFVRICSLPIMDFRSSFNVSPIQFACLHRSTTHILCSFFFFFFFYQLFSLYLLSKWNVSHFNAATGAVLPHLHFFSLSIFNLILFIYCTYPIWFEWLLFSTSFPIISPESHCLIQFEENPFLFISLSLLLFPVCSFLFLFFYLYSFSLCASRFIYSFIHIAVETTK